MKPRRPTRQRGAALVEWLIVAPPLLFVTLGIIQTGFIMMAKTSVNYAAFEAARAGSMANASLSAITSAFTKALVPFYGGGQSAAELAASLVRAGNDIAQSGTVIQILNPTQESFQDFGVTENNLKQIPNDNLAYRAKTPGAKSGQSIQDANLLKLHITYGYRLAIPLVNSTIVALLKTLDPDPANATLYYDQGRIPIAAQATVRMQSPAYEQANLVSSPGAGNGGAGGGSGGVAPNPEPDKGSGGKPGLDPIGGGSWNPPECGKAFCCKPADANSSPVPASPSSGGGGLKDVLSGGLPANGNFTPVPSGR